MARRQITTFNKYYYNDITNLINSITSGVKNICLIESEKEFVAQKSKGVHCYVLVNCIGDLPDVQSFLEKLRQVCQPSTRITIIYYNYLWEPVLKLASLLGIRTKKHEQNWLTLDDTENLLKLANFASIKRGQRLLLPFYIPVISNLVNKYVAKLPWINKLCLINYIVARPVNFKKIRKLSVSVIVPARNEAGNIDNLINRMPKIGKKMEIIFVEGHSKDNTWETILRVKNKYKKYTIYAYQQKGVGKADAVHLGVRKANGDIAIILDADLSVPPEELQKIYDALAYGMGEFINGSRLVYPVERESMRFLNKLGNKFFSLTFSWILKQRFTDTLCGTKAFFRKDYHKILNLHKFFGNFDPFGDYELIFGASKLNLQVVEVPIHYKARTYGKSNISRFVHGWLLLKMTFFAFKKFKLD